MGIVVEMGSNAPYQEMSVMDFTLDQGANL
jgi:hypothetical protein